MTETANRRVVIFYTIDGVYHVFSDPGIEVLIGHEECCDHVLYKNRPIPEGFLDDAIIHLAPGGDRPDPINEIVLLEAQALPSLFPGGTPTLPGSTLLGRAPP